MRFLRIALGSASELEYHLLLAHELKYLNGHDYADMKRATEEVKRMLRRLLERLANLEQDSRLKTHDSRPTTDRT
jgi:four helix bundle protein